MSEKCCSHCSLIQSQMPWPPELAFDESPPAVASLCRRSRVFMSASRNHLERCHDLGSGVRSNQASSTYVSLEAEIPEVLYRGMKDFIGSHPN